MDIDLARFEAHHPHDFERALSEIRAGRKRTHWMWYVFPQFTALGRSLQAKFYGMSNAAEGEAYLRHPLLGRDYALIVDAVAEQVGRGVNITEMMGTPDDLKLVSSLTLFGGLARRLDEAKFQQLADLCDDVLANAKRQGLAMCATTASFLRDEM